MTHKNVVGEVVCHRKYAQVVQLDGSVKKQQTVKRVWMFAPCVCGALGTVSCAAKSHSDQLRVGRYYGGVDS